jgi:sensor domain CHASE-containing protein/nitrogen-specific signal transduction histidine kinase
MDLRKKILIIISGTIIALTVILYTASHTILLGSFISLEERNAHQNVERFLSALSDDLSTLDDIAYDWSAWDDTYTFIEDANQEYIDSNLVDETFAGLRLNLMIFVNSSGRTVFGKAFDCRREKEVPLPPGLEDHLSPASPLLSHPDTESSIQGILLLPEGPMLVVSRPILTSEDEGPIRGTLILGRYLDTVEVQRLGEVTHLSLSLHRMDDPELPSDLREVAPSLSGEAPILVKPMGERSIAGYALLRDIYGKPVLVVRAEMPRDIYWQGRVAVRYFVLSLLAISLVFVLGSVLLLEREVLSRLTRLSKDVRGIGATRNLSARVSIPGEDEVTDLAEDINRMLESLERSAEDLKKYARKLEESNRIKDLFRDIITHDILSQIGVIKTLSEMKLEENPEDEEMAMIFRKSKKAVEIVENAVTLAQLEEISGFEKEAVDLKDVIEKAIADLAPTFDAAGMEVLNNVEEPMPIKANQMIEHVFTNLLSNTVKYTARGKKVVIGGEDEGKSYKIYIKDYGEGVPDEHKEEIFTRFKRIHKGPVKGTGLGLAIVKMIVELHGGQVWVEDNPEGGSIFYVRLPKGGIDLARDDVDARSKT